MALNQLLAKYNTIIFDMDGVLTSEQNYWDIAAISAYEMLSSDKYLGKVDFDCATSAANLSMIRAHMFDSDHLIYAVKDCGVNSNWDLLYITVGLLGSKRFVHSADITKHLRTVRPPAGDLYKFVAECMSQQFGESMEYYQRNGEFWTKCVHVFQEWYLGSEMFPKLFDKQPLESNKPPLYGRERPIIPLGRMEELLAQLNEAGKRLGVATGRPVFEMDQPLDMWGIRKYFDPKSLINYTHILNCEATYGDECPPLTKPHPYMFIKAFLGEDYPDIDIIKGGYNADFSTTLIVGDAGADILAAQAIPCDFCAVLTGASGAKAKKYFLSQGATYILPNVGEFLR